MSTESKKQAAIAHAAIDALAAMVPADPAPIPPEPTPPIVIPPPSGTKYIYASQSSGSDIAGTGTEANPYQTIAKGIAAMDDGKPVQLRLKRGDTFTAGYTKYARYGGASATERHTIGSYGSGPRPRITGQLDIGAGEHQMHHITLSECDFIGPGHKAQIWGGDYLIASCDFIGAVNGPVLKPESYPTKPLSGVSVHDVVSYNLQGTGQTHGLYAYGVASLTIDGCVLDAPAVAPDGFDHQMYLQAANTNVTIRGCSILRANDAQIRSGGTLDGNLIIGLEKGLTLGRGTEANNVPGGATLIVRKNVWLGGNRCMHLGNIKSAEITDNVFADGTGTSPVAAWIEGGFAGVSNIKWHHNVHRKHGGVSVQAGLATPGCTFTETNERVDLYGVNLALDSFGFPDIYAALRNGQTTAAEVVAEVRQRVGLLP